MGTSTILFLGAGKCNVVVDVPMSYVSGSLGSARCPGDVATQRAALRIRNAGHRECLECYRALEAFAGKRQVVGLPADLHAAIASVVPARYHALMQNASEATLLPNFTSDPAHLLKMDVTASDVAERVADYTVEVKPKSVWRPPQVVGIVVNGTAHWIGEVKRRHCRYAQMLRYKEVRGKAEEGPAPMVAPAPRGSAGSVKNGGGCYCPNYLFRPTLSSREGLQRLLRSPENNLKVISYHESRRKNEHPCNPKVLTVEEINGIADAIDASQVLAPLAHLQLYGCAPTSADALPEETPLHLVPVLDADLLHHWSTARKEDDVQWIVVDSDPETLCSCASLPDDNAAKRLCCANPRYVAPLLDYATCLDRFYVSTTAKDVSLLIAVSRSRGKPETSASGFVVVADVPPEVGGGLFLRHGSDVYRVGVVDLDAKTHKSLEHYYLHDQNIVNAFMAHRIDKQVELE
ncbi:hypothetical protein JKF63_01933 [Porcisia hertigi]|uniref:Inositol-pentakisphosphate 2-kinase n=1 Tax=Porcisia hertigi TaxID=2761500 RepID=A0A836IGP1_9TRYP|nr:hypothetical protein JKF63_01933 [Porcisia hertigi]